MCYTLHDSTVKQTLYICDNHFCIFFFFFFIQGQMINFSIGQNGLLFVIGLVLYRFCSFLTTWESKIWIGNFSRLAQIIIPLVVIISVAQICYECKNKTLSPLDIVLCIPPCITPLIIIHVNIPHIVIIIDIFNTFVFTHAKYLFWSCNHCE